MRDELDEAADRHPLNAVGVEERRARRERAELGGVARRLELRRVDGAARNLPDDRRQVGPVEAGAGCPVKFSHRPYGP